MPEHLWVLVLAAGEGSRIRHLTTDAQGRSVPKQYASFNGEASMLRQTLDRAERIVPRERVAVVVARQHRAFWAAELADLPPWNVIVQPLNRGTGLVYEALPTCDFSRDILEREADRLAVLPARPCGWTDIGTPDRLSRVFERPPGAACVA